MHTALYPIFQSWLVLPAVAEVESCGGANKTPYYHIHKNSFGFIEGVGPLAFACFIYPYSIRFPYGFRAMQTVP